MRQRILILGVISVVLQSCANYSNFNSQKYTKLRFKASIVDTSDQLLIPQDSIFSANEIAVDAVIPAICMEEIITFHHEENSQRGIDEQSFEMEKTSSQDITTSSIPEVRTKKNVTVKKRYFNKAEETYGLLLYIFGATLVFSGVVAPLFASLLGWWIILIAFAAILLGAVLMTEGAQKMQRPSEAFGWTGVYAFFIGLICFGITSIIGIIILTQ